MEAAPALVLEPRLLAAPPRADEAPSYEPARFELRCSACGYGVVVRIAPERCPMCRGSVWEHPHRPHRQSLRYG